MRKFLLFTGFFFLGFSCSNDDDGGSNPTPSNEVRACFSQSINGGIISFNSSCSNKANEWEWDFGDGRNSISENPTHEFTSPGTFKVTLKVTDEEGNTNTTSKSVSINEVCKTCTITISGTSSSSSFCGTKQQSDSFCVTCTSGGGGTASCN